MNGSDVWGWRGANVWSISERPPEREQALLRIFLSPLALLAYLFVTLFEHTQEAYALLWACVFYLVFSLVTYASINVMPAPSRIRLVTSTVIDQASVVMALAVGGRVALPMLWAFFWFLVGAGCRYGKRMLALSCAVALVGLAGLMRWEPWWQTNPLAGLGIVLGVAATSIYLAVLVHRLEKRAATDPLTGLSNRLCLEQSIAQALRTPDGEAGQAALLLVDLDGFKEVNDAYGHGVGDKLLQHFAHALRARMRRGDTLSRLGGDEFVILARQVHGSSDARTIAEGVHSILKGIHTIDEHPISVSASIGVCLLSVGAEDEPLDIPSIMRRTDSAMYRAKALGKDQTVFAHETSL
ncbi:membrane protein [Pandoraea eparura]|uniref:Membrane protein n=1 Tax=Pandoraea eparura TaxID=2508291 RepID=A0A5E4RB00_9BURK|nr:GGDEF domain-containing protein [Pandoraea eparura]VVD60536.1 membrane protein [Pandoraea eparura]